jgi:hypothetical protein
MSFKDFERAVGSRPLRGRGGRPASEGTQNMRHVRLSRLALAGCAAALLTTGCGVVDQPSGEASQPSAPVSDGGDTKGAEPTSDASDAGGICEYLDFTAFSEATGQPFSVAEAGGADEVTSCVLLTTIGSLPEITFTKAQTTTDTDTYETEIPPKGAETIKDLGKTAYSAVRKAEGKIGPAVEIGWLTKGQMYSLRYTTAAGTDKDTAAKTVKALVSVARQVGEATDKDEKKD